MDDMTPRQRRDVLRLVAVAVVGLAAWLPLELVRRDLLPTEVFVAYVVIALGYVVITLPGAVRSIVRNRPAPADERYWTID